MKKFLWCCLAAIIGWMIAGAIPAEGGWLKDAVFVVGYMTGIVVALIDPPPMNKLRDDPGTEPQSRNP